MSEKLHSVLFVCTGNIFRSLTAEYALKSRLVPGMSCIVGSAGIEAKPQFVHPWVQVQLREKGVDPTLHVQRQLTQELIEAVDLVIAMGRNHQVFVRERFGLDIPLFNQVCLGLDQPILDLHEAIPDWETDPVRARLYLRSVIDAIWATAPTLLSRLH